MTATTKRSIVHIDEGLCNGCGACVTPCAEGAIQIIDGKAKVVKEELCDGAGFCLGVCPTGAMSIEQREAPAFSHEAVEQRKAEVGTQVMTETCFVCGRSEMEKPLLPCRNAGSSVWVCTGCLPGLIHG